MTNIVDSRSVVSDLGTSFKGDSSVKLSFARF